MVVNHGTVSIDVRLRNGIYVLDKEEEAERNYLAELLGDRERLGDNVGVYSYSDYILGMSCIKKINSGKKVIVLCDFDKYSSGKIRYALNRFKNKMIILVDGQNPDKSPRKDDIANIKIEFGRVVVY